MLDMSSNSWVIKTRHFKLTGKKEYFFRLHIVTLKGIDSNNGIAVLYCYNNRIEHIDSEHGVEGFINKTMRNCGLKYVELSEDEVKFLELLYAV